MVLFLCVCVFFLIFGAPEPTHLFVCVLVQNGSVNVDSVVTVAARLAEAGHYGAERIALVSSKLQDNWKSMTSALEERSNMLAMATGFHQGAEQVIFFFFSGENKPSGPSIQLTDTSCPALLFVSV